MRMIRYLAAIACVALFAVSNAQAAPSGGSRSKADNKTEAPFAEVDALIAKFQYDAAVQHLEAMRAKDPKDADVYNYLGLVHRKMQKFDEAAADYETALKLDPRHRGALEYQAQLFLKQEKKAEAKANLEKLRKLCPKGCRERDLLERAVDDYEKGLGSNY